MCLSELKITARGDMLMLCYTHAAVWEFSAFCSWTVYVCVCAVGPSVSVPCTSRGAGGAPGGQAVCSWQCDVHADPLREAPRPQAATRCLCLRHHCARLWSGHLHSGNRWFHDAAHPASGENKPVLHVTNCPLGLSFDLVQCRKGTRVSWLICESNWFSY